MRRYFGQQEFKPQGKVHCTFFLLCVLLVAAMPGPARADADLALSKTVSNATPVEGEQITYTLTLVNNGSPNPPQNVSNLTVSDVLPAGVTYVTDDGAGTYDNTTGIWDPSPIQNGAVRTLNITVSVDTGTAGMTITNSAAITYSNRFDPNSSNNSASVDISVGGVNLLFLKSVQTFSDPFSGSNPKAIPGAVMRYTIQLSNQGLDSADTDSIFVTDSIPANSEMFVGDAGGVGSGPILFSDGSPTSGLTYTFISLGSATDDLEFSSDNGASWTYIPVPDVDGFDAGVTNVRINPKGTLNASDGVNHPNFSAQFRVRLQ